MSRMLHFEYYGIKRQDAILSGTTIDRAVQETAQLADDLGIACMKHGIPVGKEFSRRIVGKNGGYMKKEKKQKAPVKKQRRLIHVAFGLTRDEAAVVDRARGVVESRNDYLRRMGLEAAYDNADMDIETEEPKGGE